ncbi:hypothetical protein HBDW_36140 [Herbaspirillum sp. DW155]|uniref:hypothetical protein n=1 Tax=Herbaspirillum sp. DW155 TaxID=3095609 RepID=UPI00308C4E4C|nr:hypothetical protein HBDW_36140 [Herbaspirillum sp. DW155]
MIIGTIARFPATYLQRLYRCIFLERKQMGNLCVGSSSGATYEPNSDAHREITAQEFQARLVTFRTSEIGLTEEQQAFVSQGASTWISVLQRNLFNQTQDLIRQCEHHQQLRLEPSTLDEHMTRLAAEWASLRTELEQEMVRLGWSGTASQNAGQNVVETDNTMSAMPVIVDEPTSDPRRRRRRIGFQNF